MKDDLREAGWILVLWTLAGLVGALTYVFLGWVAYLVGAFSGLLFVGVFMLDPVRVLSLLDEYTGWDP